MESRKVGPAAGNRGKGRKKGVPNKFTGQLKEMILQALHNKGGVEYLEAQAEDNPVAFMGLVGKVLPMTVANADPEGFRFIIETGVRRASDPAG